MSAPAHSIAGTSAYQHTACDEVIKRLADIKPSPAELWHQADGDSERYRELMRQHGHLLSPGDEGYEQVARKLPCGWEPGKRREEQDRCELTDLLRDSCSHCTGRGEEVPERDTSAFGPWFTAAYPGRCSVCDERIEPGDEIRADGEGGYRCAECGREDGATDA